MKTSWLLAAIVFAVVAVFFVAFACVQALLEHRRRREAPGGFEVKLNTGEEPVIEKKENDHG